MEKENNKTQNTERKLNIVNLTLGIVVAGALIAIAIFYTPIINANTWKVNIENQIEKQNDQIKENTVDIYELKNDTRNSEKILFEMNFNLKNYLQSKGFPYIENPEMNKSSKEQ